MPGAAISTKTPAVSDSCSQRRVVPPPVALGGLRKPVQAEPLRLIEGDVMTDQLPRAASEPGAKPPQIEYVAGPGEAGDSACWAQFVCPECGAMLTEDTSHAEGCHADRDPSAPC